MMNLQKDQHKIKKIPLQWAEAGKNIIMSVRKVHKRLRPSTKIIG